MQIKGSDVIGLKIVTIQQGKALDKVEDLVYDPQENKVKALLIDSGGWFSDAKVILLDAVKSIGRDAVMVDSDTMLKKASEIPQPLASIVRNDQYLTTTKIITETGNELGIVADIYFDGKTGEVSELEVSQGGMKNLQSGKKRVKVSDIITVGEDATVVKAYTEDTFSEQGKEQGIEGAWHTVQQETSSLTEKAKKEANNLNQQFDEQAKVTREHPRAKNTMGQLKKQAEQAQARAKNEAPMIAEDIRNILNRAGTELEDRVRDMREHEYSQKIANIIRMKTKEMKEDITRSLDEQEEKNLQKRQAEKGRISSNHKHRTQYTGSLGGKSTKSKAKTPAKKSSRTKKK